MTQLLYSIIGFIVALGILVAVHEFGHFWVARKLGVKVLRFSIGFGRPLWSRTGKVDGTEYVLGAIPLGGYVKMLEDDGSEPPEEARRAFNRQGLPVRAAIVLAGPFFNFLFAIVAYAIVFGMGVTGLKPVIGDVVPGSLAEQAGLKAGDEIVAIDGRPNQIWRENRLYLFNSALKQDAVSISVVDDDGASRDVQIDFANLPAREVDSLLLEKAVGVRSWAPPVPATIGEVVPDNPAALAGLEIGDEVIAVDGTAVADWVALVEYIQPRFEKSVTFSVLRDGQTLDLEIEPVRFDTEQGPIGRIGVRPELIDYPESMQVKLQTGPIASLGQGVENTWMMSNLTVKMLWRMLKLEVSPKNISGPITIAKYAGRTARRGFESFITFLAVVSISLGVLNLLPIPVLDGGHLLYYIVEAIKGGPLSDRIMEWTQQVGILMLGALMCLAFYNDIVQLFG